MKIKIWGGRGSLPSPLGPDVVEERIIQTLRLGLQDFKGLHPSESEIVSWAKGISRGNMGGFGGNTACIEIESANSHLIIDAGSGIRALGYDLLRNSKNISEVNLLFTHFHWDHIIGLPFFLPVFSPKARINAFAVQDDIHKIFPLLFQKPYFPVPLSALKSNIQISQLEPRRPKTFGDLKVTPYQLDHPDPCWGFRIEDSVTGGVFAYCVDTEAKRTTAEELGPDLPLYQNVDLMIFDSQYTLGEVAIEKEGWGHAAAPIGLDIAMREGIKKVVFVHHDPAATDLEIEDAAASTALYYKSRLRQSERTGIPLHTVDWCFGHEGMVFEV